MPVEHVSTKRCDILRLSGRIDSSTAPDFEAAVNEIMNAGRYHIVLNVKDLSFMSSAGLRVLITASKECRKHRGDVRLTEVNEKIADVLSLAGLTELFQIFTSEGEAAGSF